MNEIALIASNIDYANVLKENLNIYFKDHATFNTYNVKEVNDLIILKEKYVVLSSYAIFQVIKSKIDENAKLMIINLALPKNSIEELKKIPDNSRALLVNIDYRTCMQIITDIFSLGYYNLDLIPYYKLGEKYDKEITIAITPDEIGLVPDGIKEVINIGQRVISYGSISELANMIGVEKVLDKRKLEKLKASILETENNIHKIIGENLSLIDSINILIKLIDQGILITNSSGRITMCNQKANKLLLGTNNTIIGLNIIEFFPDINVMNDRNHNEKYDKLYDVLDENVIVSCRSIVNKSKFSGYVVTVDKFDEIENRQNSIRNKIIGHGHKAIFQFKDIIGVSDEILKVKEIAKRISNSNSSLLIFGDTGTGKELFAQAIHNASYRCKNNFVAINCATLPANLLESELFGYEHGAFSGAKKGGKIGLLELANKGTLFLDEIGEIPIALQAKLLRVLEEQKFIKLGGSDVLSADIRVIAATNKDLLDMAKEGKFRKDLYYRLSVLPLKIPNLAKRKDDIMVIFNYFKSLFGSKISLTKEAENLLINYSWPGNIRQLKNLVEYLSNLNQEYIDIIDIPIEYEEVNIDENSNEMHYNIIYRFLLNEDKNLNTYAFILKNLEKSYKQSLYIGRYKLLDIAKEENYFTSLSELKYCLTKLNDYGFIKSYHGRKGSIITEMGIELKIEINKHLRIGLIGT